MIQSCFIIFNVWIEWIVVFQPTQPIRNNLSPDSKLLGRVRSSRINELFYDQNCAASVYCSRKLGLQSGDILPRGNTASSVPQLSSSLSHCKWTILTTGWARAMSCSSIALRAGYEGQAIGCILFWMLNLTRWCDDLAHPRQNFVSRKFACCSYALGVSPNSAHEHDRQ